VFGEQSARGVPVQVIVKGWAAVLLVAAAIAGYSWLLMIFVGILHAYFGVRTVGYPGAVLLWVVGRMLIEPSSSFRGRK
jgi:hypothetical protein